MTEYIDGLPVADSFEPDDCPHHPDAGCPWCADYWQRMENEGLWKDGEWTDAAVEEWLKNKHGRR